MAVWYCEEVVAKRVPACKWEILACQRFLDMKKASETATAAFVWSNLHAVDACAFIEKLPHTKAFSGRIVLEPVQCWWICNVVGFRERDTGYRWMRAVSFWIPRKNTKTTLSVGLVLFCLLCEDEPGAEATISAGSEGQAHVPYDMIRKTLDLEPDLRTQFQAYDTRDYTEFRRTGAKITLATARAKNLDGLNPHILLAEELHAQSQEVIGVLRTAMGARRAPLSLSISTAGRDATAAAYEDWQAAEAVLDGRIKAPRTFSVLYAADKDDVDRRFDPRVIEKVNPLYGIALHPEAVAEEIAEARKSESKLNEYLRTRLNVWSRAAGNLISVDSWNACADPKLRLDAFVGYPLFVGIDLASRSDLNAAAYLTVVDGVVYTTGQYWLPAQAKRMVDDRFADAFRRWHADGWLDLTAGVYVDYKVILRRILETIKAHRVIGVGLDDYQANLMAREIEEAGYQVFIVPKRAKYMTQATDDLIARTEDPALFHHDGNPVSAWCAGNVVGHYDQNSNVLPKKERPNSKANIDGMDALIIANALRLDWEAGVLGASERTREMPNPYLDRGLAGAA